MPKTIRTSEYKQVVERLKQARLDVGLTQKEVSDKIKKPQSYVSKVEAGEQRLDILELKLFAKLYSKSLDYFIK
ncbi:MAG: helix-turn-helix transcriptional regulator [Patescibacteria group bacterium]|nr:helix-turn-helix transcriptional regulator [Patescibacteria group bacterium]